MDIYAANIDGLRASILTRPGLAYYHANAKSTGTAVKFRLLPAGQGSAGGLIATFAQQMAGISYAAFDWDNSASVQLGITDCAKVLGVLGDNAGSIDDGKGLFARAGRCAAVLHLVRRDFPCVGYEFELMSCGPDGQQSRFRLELSADEALGLEIALTHSLPLIAFGAPDAAAEI